MTKFNLNSILLFLLIYLGDIVSLTAQNADIYFPTGMKWKEVVAEPRYLPLDTTYSRIYEVGPDTVVNKHTYKRVFRNGETTQLFVREDSGLVWLLSDEYEREILLYDFNDEPDKTHYTEYIRETDNGMEVFQDVFSVSDYQTMTYGTQTYQCLWTDNCRILRGIGRVADLHRNGSLLGYRKMKVILPGYLFMKVLWINRNGEEIFRSEIAEEWTSDKPNTSRIECLTPNPSLREGGTIYDLSGRKVSSQSSYSLPTRDGQGGSLRKGLYIKDGKKIIVK